MRAVSPRSDIEDKLRATIEADCLGRLSFDHGSGPGLISRRACRVHIAMPKPKNTMLFPQRDPSLGPQAPW